MPNRRTVLAILSAVGWDVCARAESKPRVIGVLSPYSSSQMEPYRSAFVREMQDLGYVNGKDYVIVELS